MNPTAASVAFRDEPCEEGAITSPRLKVILALGNMLEFICAQGPQEPALGVVQSSIFHSCEKPSLPIRTYLHRIVRYARPSTEALVHAGAQVALLLEHALVAGTAAAVCLYSIHRIFGIALLVQAKFDDDIYFSNAYMAGVLGMQLREVNEIELEYLDLIKFDVWIRPATHEQFMINYLFLDPLSFYPLPPPPPPHFQRQKPHSI